MSSLNSNQQSVLGISSSNLRSLANHIKAWGKALGFQQVGICDIDLAQHYNAYKEYLENNYHGSMSFLERNLEKRLKPDELHPNTCRIISVRLDYLPPDASFAEHLSNDKIAYISRYALGRDYHKVMRKRLKSLGEQIKEHCESLDYRPFVDSAPVLEHALAEKAGIGWTGKHTLTLHNEAGSWFFLGELFINLPLPIDSPIQEQCGSCVACINICPTKAIVAPYKLDAKRCISYLTIEHEGAIAEEYREAMGNRVYGCDDCQLVCPWNRYAQVTNESDFYSREALFGRPLLTLFELSENEFLDLTTGSPIRRIGYFRWRRNLSVAMGNAHYDELIIASLEKALEDEDNDILTEHFSWALKQQVAKRDDNHSRGESSRQHQRLIRIVQKGLPRDA